MGKMNELSKILEEMIACGQGMIRAAQELEDMYSGEAERRDKPQEAPITEELAETKVEVEQCTPPSSSPTYTFTDVRKAFCDKAHAGYTEQIRALILSHGADKLSSVKEEDYPALMAELEQLT